MKNNRIKKLVILAMLGSISYVLMLLNFPFPGFPVFLKIDFSEVPVLIAALIFGPGAAIITELIKNLLDFFMTGSPTGVPVGHIANFVAGIVFVLPVYFVYKKMRSKKGMTIALAAGTMTMAILMSLLNYFVFLPAYTIFMGAEGMTGSETIKMVTMAILPFNVIKGIVITVVFMLMFVQLQPWLKKQSHYNNA
ncbi:ECF transporter S component [Peribacillus sp. SCS-155]|uniref:ECF transporter S component n=1 Tax=Peribacillus sedimenti TaxID=3115297 RepID=UPI003905E270